MPKKKYFTEEERLEAKRAYNRKWKAEHKQEIAEKAARYYQEYKKEKLEYIAKWRAEHKAERAEYMTKYNTKYYNTKEGRARFLIKRYKQADKKYGRGEYDLTIPWFVRNIFTKCIYCGETDWKKLGCDRIDNSKAHTIVNVVPCCMSCNRNRQKKPFEQFYWEMKHEKTLGDES